MKICAVIKICNVMYSYMQSYMYFFKVIVSLVQINLLLCVFFTSNLLGFLFRMERYKTNLNYHVKINLQLEAVFLNTLIVFVFKKQLDLKAVLMNHENIELKNTEKNNLHCSRLGSYWKRVVSWMNFSIVTWLINIFIKRTIFKKRERVL